MIVIIAHAFQFRALFIRHESRLRARHKMQFHVLSVHLSNLLSSNNIYDCQLHDKPINVRRKLQSLLRCPRIAAKLRYRV